MIASRESSSPWLIVTPCTQRQAETTSIRSDSFMIGLRLYRSQNSSVFRLTQTSP